MATTLSRTPVPRSEEAKVQRFLSVIPCLTEDAKVEAIQELEPYRLRGVMRGSHNMVAAAYKYCAERTRKPRGVFKYFVSENRASRAVESLEGELPSLEELKVQWQIAFCKAYASETKPSIGAEVFFEELEWIWKDSVVFQLDDYLPVPKFL